MYPLLQLSLIAMISMALSENCPNTPFPLEFEYKGGNSTTLKIRLPIYAQKLEIATLKNDTVAGHFIVDESILNDPTKTTLNYSYSTSINNFNVDIHDLFVVCLTLNIIRNGNVTTCRMCKLTTVCLRCPNDIYKLNTKTFNDGTGQIEMTAIVQIPMNVEWSITGKTSTSSYSYNNYPQSYNGMGPYNYGQSYYYGMSTPSPYNNYGYNNNAYGYDRYAYYGYTNNPQGYNSNPYASTNSPNQCPNANNTFSPPKTKLNPNAFTLIKLDNLKSNYIYDVQPKFEVDWQGKAPFGWPDSLPLVVDSTLKQSFTAGVQCSTS